MKALCRDDDAKGLPIAPLIDIVFLLLIFFLVATTLYEEEKDITVRLAEATEGQDRERAARILVVNVNESGVIVVNQRVKTLDELAEMLETAKREAPDVVVVVRCDRHAYHQHFVRILNLCEKLGVRSVAVATFQTEA